LTQGKNRVDFCENAATIKQNTYTLGTKHRLTPNLTKLRGTVLTALLVVHATTLNPVGKGCHFVSPYEQEKHCLSIPFGQLNHSTES